MPPHTPTNHTPTTGARTPARGDDAEHTMRCTDPIPLNPTRPGLIAREARMLEQWDADLEQLHEAGWTIERASRMENPPAGTYRLPNLFTRTASQNLA